MRIKGEWSNILEGLSGFSVKNHTLYSARGGWHSNARARANWPWRSRKPWTPVTSKLMTSLLAPTPVNTILFRRTDVQHHCRVLRLQRKDPGATASNGDKLHFQGVKINPRIQPKDQNSITKQKCKFFYHQRTKSSGMIDRM